MAPFGFDLSAVERAVVQLVDGAESGVAQIRVVEWPVPEAFLWFVLRDRQPVREGEWITAYSIDRLSIEEPLAKFREALKARNFDEMRKVVHELYEARLNRTLWQIVYEFDRERAEAALEYLRQRYGEPESRVWERHDELYLTWLAFRLADEFEAYLRSGVGRGLRTKEEVAEAVYMPWLPDELVPVFMRRLVGDEDGWGEFRATWITAVNMWFERMAEPYSPKKPAVARKAVELFNAFVGAKFTYEELFPPPQKPAEAAKPAGAKREAVKPETVVKPETAKPEIKPAERPAVEVQRLEERGLRREVEKQAAKPEAAKPEAVKPAEVKRAEAVKPAEAKPAAEVVEVRGLRRLGEKPRAPIADVIPERVLEAVDYLIERFGFALDREAAFKAKSLVTAKVKARLEKVAVKEPEFAHILAEVAEHVLSSFGRLMASPDAARHVHDALFYFFEGYQTRDGEVLFARIERTVREAVKRAEEAGIPDAEYRIKQFVLEVIDVLARAGERYRRDALKGISTVEKALRATVFAGFSAAALYSVYSGLYSEAVVSSVASAVALVDVGRFREAVEYVQRAAKALYEAAREVFEHVKITVQRLVELFVETVARVLAWVDEHKAYLFLMAAVAAGVVALSVALNMWGMIELEKLAYAAVGAPFVAGLADAGGRAAGRFVVVAERWRVDENEKQKIEEVINEVINAPLKGGRPFSKLTRLKNLPKPLVELRKALKDVKDEAVQDAAVVAALVLYKTLVKNAEVYREWAELYRWARGLVKEREFAVKAEEVKRLRGAQRRLEEVAEEVRRELNAVLALYASHSRDLYEKLKPHLEVDWGMAEGLAEARVKELSNYSDVNMGTKAYAALLSVARGGIYGHAATLLMAEGALADLVLSAPSGTYNKADRIANARGETVDPSYSGRRGRSVRQPSWEDRAASVLLRFLIGYGEADLKFRHVEKGGRKGRVERGFQVFRVYGGVEAFVGELWIGKTEAYFKVSKEELKRLVEEAERTAPDLSGIRKIWQTLEWLNTDVSFTGRQIEGSTVHLWQLKWYIALFGRGRVSGGVADVTEEDIKLKVAMRWSRETLDRIIAEEGKELEPLLGRPVKSWRELVDAIDWSWVLERVRELAGKLRPWIGPEKMDDIEREGLAKRMLGELALFVHFAEARRGLDDGEWKEKRTARLTKALEALSGGKIVGDDANELAKLIIRYAERREERTKGRIDNLAKKVGVSREEVWGVVERVLSGEDPYVYCLARDCARDEVVRKFVAPALELMMLDKALNDNDESNRERARLLFGEMYATALAGDGHVGQRRVELIVGGELGGGAALLRLAALYLLNELLTKELKFDVRVYVGEGVYKIAALGDNAAGLMRLLAVTAPSAGGEYLSDKFNEFVKEAKVEVQFGNIRLTKSGVAADLTISEGGAAVKYNVYLRDAIVLEFRSTDRNRVELATLLLKLAGVTAEVKTVGDGNEWRVIATTRKLSAGREELRKALAEIVRRAVESGLVDASKAEVWLEKLEEGRVLKEGWPEYLMRLVEGALVVRFASPNPDSIRREAQRLRDMGLKEGRHFTVKMPEEGRDGYVYIRKEGLAHTAWLSVHGKDEQQRKLAAKFVEYILKRAEEADKKVKGVYEKAKEIVEEGKAWGALKLKDFEKKVEVNGKTYVVKVIGGEAVEEDRDGRKLLRIKITAEVGRVEGGHIVDRVEREYTITYGRYDRNAAKGSATARANAPGGREADAERFSALIKALTGREPRIYRMKDGRIKIECYEGHLEGFMRYAELADAIERWLEDTDR
jgi:23S rRNA pseudoU1915 N3-methylase RlmH